MLGKSTGKVWQANKPPLDHESDVEEFNDKGSLSEVSQRTDRMEFIEEFQEIMNKAIEQLLNKPVRKQTCWKNKPEMNTEQEKHRKTIHKEADMPPPRRVSRESDDEWNSIALQELMDTDKCIQRLVRSEPKGSDHAQQEIEALWAMSRYFGILTLCHQLDWPCLWFSWETAPHAACPVCMPCIGLACLTCQFQVHQLDLIEFILLWPSIWCHLSHDFSFATVAKSCALVNWVTHAFIQNSCPCFCPWAKITLAYVLNSMLVLVNVAELPLSVTLIRLFSMSGTCLTSHNSIMFVLVLTLNSM